MKKIFAGILAITMCFQGVVYAEPSFEWEETQAAQVVYLGSKSKATSSLGDPKLGRQLGDISMGNNPLAPYYESNIIVPRPAQSEYKRVAKVSTGKKLQDIKGHWAEKYIKRFVEAGYISGYEDGTFRPNDNVTYAEFASIVARMQLKPVRFGGAELSKDLFSDAGKTSAWYHEALLIGQEAGLFGNEMYINGGTQSAYGLRASDDAQRERIALFLGNMIAYKKEDLQTKLLYKDTNKINTNSNNVIVNAVKRLVAADVISGYPDNTFRPQDKITRAEMVVMLTNVLDCYGWDMDKVHDNLYGNYYRWNWEQEALLLDMVNAERVKQGVSPLKYDIDLHALATVKSIEKYTYGYYSGGSAHSTSLYGIPSEMAKAFGLPYLVAENAALLQSGSAKRLHELWTESENHHMNYLVGHYEYAGFAITTHGYGYELFGVPKV